MSVPEALVHSIRILVVPGVFCSTSVAQMLAAASIKVMDALFGLVARNDAEWSTSFILLLRSCVLLITMVLSAVTTCS